MFTASQCDDRLPLMAVNIVAGGAASYNIYSDSPLDDKRQQEWVLQEVAYKSQSTTINQNSKGMLIAQNCQFHNMILFYFGLKPNFVF